MTDRKAHPYFQDRDAFIASLLEGLQPRMQPQAAPQGMPDPREATQGFARDALAGADLAGMGASLAPLAREGAMPQGAAADVMSQVAPGGPGAAVNPDEQLAYKKQALRQAFRR